MSIVEGRQTWRLRTDLGRLGSGQADRIVAKARELLEHIDGATQDTTHGLLYGQVQSGKTYHVLAAVALGQDSGRRLFIVLTSDNTWLYEQTLTRIRQALPGLMTMGHDQLQAPDRRIPALLRTAGVVLVATKNGRRLERLVDFVRQLDTAGVRPIIFDDEADQASLNTEVNQADVSAVNQRITELRDCFPQHDFIQVTATPQALFLQQPGTEFWPSYAVVFTPGPGYVGGEHFFEDRDPQAFNSIRFIPQRELDELVGARPPGPGGFAVPASLRQALSTFFVGAAVQLCRGEGTTFASLFHISHRQDLHARVADLIQSYVNELSEGILGDDPQRNALAERFLQEGYDNIADSDPELPHVEEVVEEIRNNIASTMIQVIDARTAGRADTGAPFTILIGGNRMGRGVTIDGLILTFYGRTSNAPQVDTVLQHARMYGYRQQNVGVIRLYTTDSLFEVFCNIHESEKALRETVETVPPGSLQPLIMSRSSHGILRPTRSNVIYLPSLTAYMPGRSYFPREPLPSAENLRQLDALLQPFVDNAQPTELPIAHLVEIVNLTASAETPGIAWNDEAIRTCLRIMDDQELFDRRGFLIVRGNSDVRRDMRALISESVASLSNAASVVGPVLTMLRLNAAPDKGWNGGPRWIPHVQFPQGITYFLFSTQ